MQQHLHQYLHLHLHLALRGSTYRTCAYNSTCTKLHRLNRTAVAVTATVTVIDSDCDYYDV
jgi:hypothetical protein